MFRDDFHFDFCVNDVEVIGDLPMMVDVRPILLFQCRFVLYLSFELRDMLCYKL